MFYITTREKETGCNPNLTFNLLHRCDPGVVVPLISTITTIPGHDGVCVQNLVRNVPPHLARLVVHLYDYLSRCPEKISLTLSSLLANLYFLLGVDLNLHFALTLQHNYLSADALAGGPAELCHSLTGSSSISHQYNCQHIVIILFGWHLRTNAPSIVDVLYTRVVLRDPRPATNEKRFIAL